MVDLFSILLAIIVIVMVLNIKQNYSRQLPGPPIRPLIGNLFVLSDASKTHETFLNLHKQYGDNIELNVLNQRIISTRDYQLMKELFLKRDDFPLDTDASRTFKYLSGPTMFTSEGEVWRKRHSVLLPLLNQSMLKKNADLVVKTIYKLAEKIEVGKSIDIASLINCAGFDIIGNIAFGAEFNLIDDPDKKLGNDRFLDVFSYIEKAFLWRMTLYRMGLDKLEKFPFPSFKKEQQVYANLSEMLKHVIEEHEKSPIPGESTDLIYQMMKQTEKGHNYNVTEMIAESFSLFTAGQGTSSTSLSILLDFLANNHHIQKRLQQEVDEIYASKPIGWRPSFEDLSQMPYLENVLKEFYRLYPVVPFSAREATRDISVNGINFRKGDKLFLNIYSYHRDPAVFENPEEFNPDRWNSHPNIPLTTFGMGSRMCFGKKLAILEMKLITFILMRHFTLEPDPSKPTQLGTMFLLQPVNNQIWLKAHRREFDTKNSF